LPSLYLFTVQKEGAPISTLDEGFHKDTARQRLNNTLTTPLEATSNKQQQQVSAPKQTLFINID
jgi:hypothetical protein